MRLKRTEWGLGPPVRRTKMRPKIKGITRLGFILMAFVAGAWVVLWFLFEVMSP